MSAPETLASEARGARLERSEGQNHRKTTTVPHDEICRRLVQTSTVVLVEVAAPEYVSMYALFVSIAEIEVPVTQLNSDAVCTRCMHPFTVQYP